MSLLNLNFIIIHFKICVNLKEQLNHIVLQNPTILFFIHVLYLEKIAECFRACMKGIKNYGF